MVAITEGVKLTDVFSDLSLKLTNYKKYDSFKPNEATNNLTGSQPPQHKRSPSLYFTSPVTGMGFQAGDTIPVKWQTSGTGNYVFGLYINVNYGFDTFITS